MKINIACFALIFLLSSPAIANDPSFCRDVNAQWKQCQTMKVDCETALQSTDKDIIESIKQCPISAMMDMMPPSGKHPEIGVIPCCIQSETSPSTK